MDKVKPNSEPETLDAPSTFGGRRPSSCSACGGCGMIPGAGPNDDVMNTPCPECNPWAVHDRAWQDNFVVPIAKTMKQKGVAYLLILIRDDGKAAYVMDTEIPPNDQEMATLRADAANTQPD